MKRHLKIAALFIALPLAAWAANKMTSVLIVNSTISSSTLSSDTITGGTVGGASISTSTINNDTITGSTINSTTIGAASPSSAYFTTAYASGSFNGSLNGNASTATQLYATPTNCGVSSVAYGISANGNALCRSSSWADYYITFTTCTNTSGSNLNPCVATLNFVNNTTTDSGQSGYPYSTYTANVTPSMSAMADSNYTVQCTVYNPSSAALFITVNALTTTSIQYTLDEVESLGQGGGYTVTAMCHLHHN